MPAAARAGQQLGRHYEPSSGARTRMEAHEMISQSLMQRGLVKGSEEYQTALDAAWKENNVSSLPGCSSDS